jgi:hypothetical protein
MRLGAFFIKSALFHPNLQKMADFRGFCGFLGIKNTKNGGFLGFLAVFALWGSVL